MSALGLVNFLLNLAALGVWLKWRSFRFDTLAQARPATLTGTLRRAEPSRLRRWHLLAALVGLLVVRSFFYWQVGSAEDWVGRLSLEPFAISFRSDFFQLMLLFSFVSFLSMLSVVYLWLLLLSLVNGQSADRDPFQAWVRLHLGRVDRWPWPLKLPLPFLLAVLFWMSFSALLVAMKMIPPPASMAHRAEQGVLIGVGVYLVWKYLIGFFLFVGIVTSYVYMGEHPLWSFVSMTCRNLTRPLRSVPLRIGKVDFTPLIGIAIVFVAAEMTERGLGFLRGRLPF